MLRRVTSTLSRARDRFATRSGRASRTAPDPSLLAVVHDDEIGPLRISKPTANALDQVVGLLLASFLALGERRSLRNVERRELFDELRVILSRNEARLRPVERRG